MKWLLLLLPLTAFAQVDFPTGAAIETSTQAIQVFNVVDGDTFDASVKVWFNVIVVERIRLYNIDTPEIDKAKCSEERALGLEAKQFLIDLFNKKVFRTRLFAIKRDSFGRVMGDVYLDAGEAGGQYLTTVLMTEGLAKVWTYGKDSKPAWCKK